MRGHQQQLELTESRGKRHSRGDQHKHDERKHVDLHRPGRRPGQLGPEAIPLETGPDLAPASSTAQGATVDGVECAPVEQLAYHIHSHLQVYVNGQSRTLPGAIGIVGPAPAQQTPRARSTRAVSPIYWLHTHTSDGIIHVESPTVRVYTLGNFFDEWGQPLSRTRVASAKGKVTAFLNGKRWRQDPARSRCYLTPRSSSTWARRPSHPRSSRSPRPNL